MRASFTFGLTLAVVSCAGSDGDVSFPATQADGGAGASGAGGSGVDGGMGGSDGGVAPVIPPTQLLEKPVGLVAVTSDGYAIYRDEAALGAVKLAQGAMPTSILEKPGTVLVNRNVVFNWAGMDWTTSLGDLSIWSAAGGTQHIGTTVYAEGLVSVSA